MDERNPKKQGDQDAKTAKTAKTAPRAPSQSLIDEERGDWEGMGQSRHQPETPPFDPKVGTPTPGSNSLAGATQK